MSTLTTKDISARSKVALSQDTFIRASTAGNTAIANAAGWGTPSDNAVNGDTWSKAGNAPTYAINSSNQGTITGAGGNTYQILGSSTLKNCETLSHFKVTALSDTAGFILRYTDSNNHYRVHYVSSTIKVVVNNAGVTTSLASASVSVSTGTLYWIKSRIVDNVGGGSCTILGKLWADGSAEPAAWSVQATDATFTSAGQFGFYTKLNASGDTVTYDSFAVYDTPALLGRDIASRTRVQAITNRDIPSRLILGILRVRDIASRLKVQAQPLRDIKARLVLQTNGAKDILTRLVLGTLLRRDLSTRAHMALAQDTFNRASTGGSTTLSSANGWGVFTSDGQVWTRSGAGATYQITNNGSVQVGQITGTTTPIFALLGRTVSGNVGGIGLFSVSSASDEIGLFLRYPSGGNQYRFRYTGATNHLTIASNVGGTVTPLANVSFTATPGALFYIRAYAAGSTLQAKIWNYGTLEPGSWQVTTTDGSLSAGQFGVYCVLASSGDSAQFAQVAFYDTPGTARDLSSRLILGARIAYDLATRFLLGTPHIQDLSTRANMAFAQDTFNRAGTAGSSSISDPAGWNKASDGRFWFAIGSGGTYQITTNGALQVGQMTGTTNPLLCQLSSFSLANCGAITLFTASSTSDEAGIFVRNPSSGNQYRFCFRNGTVQIRKNVSNTVTALISTAFPLTPGSLYYLRAYASGAVLSLRIWAYGTTEPSSWTLAASDGSFASGQFGVYSILASSGDSAQFAQFAVYDAPATLRDIATRLILLGSSAHDIATRFLLSLVRTYDLSSRTHMAIAQDTFNRAGTAGNTAIANAAGWGTTASDGETWSKNATGGAGVLFSIQTNGSTQVGQITGTTSAVTCTLGSTSIFNAGALTQFTVSSTSDEAGLLLRWGTGGKQYRFRYNNGHVSIARNSGGTVTALVSTTYTLVPGSLYTLRAATTGTYLAVKIWSVGALEPAGWTLTTSDTTLASGQFGVYCTLASTSDTAQFANFAAYNAPARNQDILARLILRGVQLRDIATRFKLSAGSASRDLGARLLLLPPSIPTPVVRDLGARLLLQGGVPPGASGVQNNLFFVGPVLPVSPLPVPPMPYQVNGVALAEYPTVANVPDATQNTLSAGSTFSLLFSSPGSATQAALATGATVSLTFALSNGQMVTGQVSILSTLTGNLFQVYCTLTQNLVITTRKVSTQFL